MISWTHITSFGDAYVTFPAAIVITVWLFTGRAWRMSWWWCLLFTLGISLVVATKLAFIGWGIGIRSLDFTGFSGHAMRAAAIIPVMIYLMLQKSSATMRATGVMLGLAYVILIAISRVILHTHSVSEAIAGLVLGCIVSFGFIWISNTLPKPKLNRWLIAFCLPVLFATSYSEPAPTQKWMTDVALYLSGHDKPYTRTLWEETELPTINAQY
jgi:membrane-associated phospholipid phosphatase